MYIDTHFTPALVAIEECLLGILPVSIRCKEISGRWHLSARVSHVWHSSHRTAMQEIENVK